MMQIASLRAARALMRSHVRSGMTIAALTVRTLDDDSFIIEMADERGSIAIHVSVPKSRNNRSYSNTERECIARHKARELGIKFSETLIGDRSH